MLFSRLCPMVLLSVALACAGCAPTKPIATSSNPLPEGVVDAGAAYAIGPMDLLEFGRTVSHGSVDIYDPLATHFMVLPPARAVVETQQAIPYNHGILVRDKSIRVYSLIERLSLPDLPEEEPKAIADPVPLRGN